MWLFEGARAQIVSDLRLDFDIRSQGGLGGGLGGIFEFQPLENPFPPEIVLRFWSPKMCQLHSPGG